jgi:hypothetical protein
MTANDNFDQCAECRMLVIGNEYHPYAACVLFKQLGQADKVRSCLDSIREYERNLIGSPAPLSQSEAREMKTAMMKVVKEYQQEYRYTEAGDVLMGLASALEKVGAAQPVESKKGK